MPPALALASVPLVCVVWYASSAALIPAAVALLVAPRVSELELSTLASVMPSQPGLGLSLSLVTSQEIVDRAHSGQFVDRRDLLTGKVSLLQQLDTVGGHHAVPFLPGMLKPRHRDVMSLPVGIYWFLAYIAIQAKDQGVQDRRAYARLMVSEAQRHGGSNWLDYDCVFRRQAILDPSLRTLCTVEFRQQHWLVALLVQPC